MINTNIQANQENELQGLESAVNNAVFSKVFHKETIAMTDSLKVAHYFGKRHDNLLSTIKNLGCSPEFNALNFKAVKYTDGKGEKRQCLSVEQLQLVDQLLSENAVMIKLGMDYHQRKAQLQETTLHHLRKGALNA
ncbi:Rha family transcriptional regulator [Pasteurella sp. PK-2025]|uniref:Rha family transcriptional regulator n=1 Tax=Pasteurella sp. PK-2025 TaxID=3413133 RepID=UPI003C7219A9